LTSIRTVFAFSGAKKEHERYVKNLNDAKYYGIKKGFLNGVLMGFLWLAMLCSYAVIIYIVIKRFKLNYSLKFIKIIQSTL
jgi:ATP-binding cassette subfamily B (MDR/TAP) protein 1